uniref:Uncharacterized protein n=1 Tax=Panagrolaimus davidi TaxID=227884 RepID=A0A914Q9T4_9BILA
MRFNSKQIDLKNISSKLWIKNDLHISSRNVSEGNKASGLVRKTFKCDAPHLILFNQIVSMDELLFLASNVQNINLDRTIVKNENGSILEFKKIVEFFPKVESFIYLISDTYKIRLETIIDEIIQAEIHYYKVPLIGFHGINEEKHCKLFKISFRT